MFSFYKQIRFLYRACLIRNLQLYYKDVLAEVSRGAEAQACGCKRDRLWVWFPLDEIKPGPEQSAAVSSASHHPVPLKFGGEWVKGGQYEAGFFFNENN